MELRPDSRLCVALTQFSARVSPRVEKDNRHKKACTCRGSARSVSTMPYVYANFSYSGSCS
jgi:hypothetical protein